jgi:hypothetical protein
MVAEPNRRDFLDEGDDARFIDGIRSYGTPGYFVVGYGVGRFLPKPGEVAVPRDPVHDRVEGLFDTRHKMLGIDFFDALQKRGLHKEFASALREVLIASDEGGERLLPWLSNVDIGGSDGIDRMSALLADRCFAVDVGREPVMRLSPTALSQGYQSMVAWISDLLGHGFLEFGAETHPSSLRGIVLLDEIDLHLHPTWQRRIVPILKRVFPELQFIVTTHSPLVLTGFEGDEIVELALQDGRVVQRPPRFEPAMQTSSELLTGYFDVDRAGRPELVRKERAYLDLRGRSERSQEEDERMNDLERELSKYWRLRPDALSSLDELEDDDEGSSTPEAGA